MITNYILPALSAPAIALVTFFLFRNKYGRGRFPQALKSFFLGMFSIALVLVFQYIATQFDLDNFKSFRRIVFYSFIIMGFGSELGKFLILRYYNFPKPYFSGPMDSIFYAVIISMGFSFAGNILYFTLPVYEVVDFTYANTVVLANLFSSVVLGFFIGLAKSRENRFVDTMTALFAASFFHALYNFCFITFDFKLLTFLSIGAAIIITLLFIKAMQLQEEIRRLKIQ